MIKRTLLGLAVLPGCYGAPYELPPRPATCDVELEGGLNAVLGCPRVQTVRNSGREYLILWDDDGTADATLLVNLEWLDGEPVGPVDGVDRIASHVSFSTRDHRSARCVTRCTGYIALEKVDDQLAGTLDFELLDDALAKTHLTVRLLPRPQ